MKHPRDRQPARRALGDVTGRESERLSEYFDFSRFPEKADLKVRRNELAAILSQLERARRERSFWHRLWRYLTEPSDRQVTPPPAPAAP